MDRASARLQGWKPRLLEIKTSANHPTSRGELLSNIDHYRGPDRYTGLEMESATLHKVELLTIIWEVVYFAVTVRLWGDPRIRRCQVRPSEDNDAHDLHSCRTTI